MNRKLVLGNKVVGGLPKQKPEKTTRRSEVVLSSAPQKEWLTLTIFGQYTDDPTFTDLEEEVVIASASIQVEAAISPERAAWMHCDGPDQIVVNPVRHLYATRVVCELPAALRQYRPGFRQGLPISPARILAGNSMTIIVPKPVITFS